MKLPRFSLRVLFVLITLISLPLGWVAYQLNWIRQRDSFLRLSNVKCWEDNSFMLPKVEPPWSLRLFGQDGGLPFLSVPFNLGDEARRLFPEMESAEALQVRQPEYFYRILNSWAPNIYAKP